MGLFPEPYNSVVCELLFLLAHWHSLAKLQMHTDETLEVLEGIMVRLGSQLRMFVNETCPAFATKELRRKVKSCRRHQVWEGQSSITQTCGASATVVGDCHPKSLNLRTYKLHALGDYPVQIQMYGTTDSYSTQPVSP